MINKLKPIETVLTVTELNPAHNIRLSPSRIKEVMRVLKKFNRTCYDGRVKTLVIQKMIQINNYLDERGYSICTNF